MRFTLSILVFVTCSASIRANATDRFVIEFQETGGTPTKKEFPFSKLMDGFRNWKKTESKKKAGLLLEETMDMKVFSDGVFRCDIDPSFVDKDGKAPSMKEETSFDCYDGKNPYKGQFRSFAQIVCSRHMGKVNALFIAVGFKDSNQNFYLYCL